MTLPRDVIGDQEEVPHDKQYMPSTRDNSMYKWQKEKGVVGAYQVHSEPDFDIRAPLQPLEAIAAETTQEAFENAQNSWKREKLHSSLAAACETIPFETAWCGLIRNDAATIKKAVPQLNKEWVPRANDKLQSYGFKVSVFLWTWSNVSLKEIYCTRELWK
jgi:hypothetical protein